MGHDDTPPSRFMQMQSMILASVRVMIDAKISMGKMTYQQSIETLIDYLGMDRVCAEAETRRFVVQPGVPTLHYWGREKMKDLRKWAKDRMEARFTDSFFHMSILHAGVLPPPLLKRELEIKIVEELRRPPDDHPHKKDDKKHHAPAAHAAPGKAAKAAKPEPKPAKAGKKAAKKKAPPAPKRKSKPAKKKR
jgi:hypothetical protein